MKHKFEWNEFADQPHNVAPRSERMRHHLRRWRTYFSMIGADLRDGLPALFLYRRYRKQMFRRPVEFAGNMFAVSASPRPGRNEEVVALLKEAGVRQTLVRIPSWEKDRLASYEDFVRLLSSSGIGLTIALLQRREDVFETTAWTRFVEDVFSRFHDVCPFYEIGHAWNRTKWGVWDYTEYLKLARPAFDLGQRYGVKMVGPAVIDFEFHLYPPTLRALPFDKVSALLYVDRAGAPENAQFGWTAAMKIALFKAVSDRSARKPVEAWITEFNWPLEGTGKYSPASGKPNVTEEEQADYLVRYYILGLASGLIERMYWWQLVAPGYGLVDDREPVWRRRPGFAALKTMIEILSGASFTGRGEASGAEIFFFKKDGKELSVCWTNGPPLGHDFNRPADTIVSRDGRGGAAEPGGRIRIERAPKYVFFRS
ncbi:MAG: hypothetical protein Q8O91_04595 [Candidatus Aminicenantes bacterium]|nr:hypothetical protein [Candidatus Aminicenantes bacterium]